MELETAGNPAPAAKPGPWDQALDAVCAALSCNRELVESPMRVLKMTPKNRKV